MMKREQTAVAAIGIIPSFENIITIGLVATPVLIYGIPYGKGFLLSLILP